MKEQAKQVCRSCEMSETKQAHPSRVIRITDEAFERADGTAVYWLGNAGILVNSRGTTILIDPVLDAAKGSIYGRSFLIPPPILGEQVKKLDAVLYTHADEDHADMETAIALLGSGAVYYTTPYTAKELIHAGIPAERIRAKDHHSVFSIGSVTVRMTGAFHPHQLGRADYDGGFFFTVNDCTGYRLETQDGVIWCPGDTILMEEHLHNTDADLVFMDFSDNEHHFGRTLSIQLANALGKSQLIMYHWGTVDASENGCFNADPGEILPYIKRPERLHILNPGEKYLLR